VFADGDDAWSKVLFELDVGRSIPFPQLPDGMAIRSLDPNTEIESYGALHRAVFGSENMTAPWRARVTRMDGYRNALDGRLGYAGYALLTTLARRQLMLGQSAILHSVAGIVAMREQWRAHGRRVWRRLEGDRGALFR
jgi:hypothetical protein